MENENKNSEPDIKVGGKVRLLAGTYGHHEPGDIGTITQVFDDDSVDVYVEARNDNPDTGWLYLRREFTPLSEAEVAALAGPKNGTADLPFEVYAGSIRVAAFATQELRSAVIGEIRDNLTVTTREAL